MSTSDPTGWTQAEAEETKLATSGSIFIVASGPNVGKVGTAAELAGETVLQEGQAYDPAVYPDLARFLAPYYGQQVVPKLSSPEWL